MTKKKSTKKKPLTVLLVDDDDFVLGALPTYLTCVPGVEITATAKNGLDALAKLTDSQPSLVVMDVRMPVMDGIETTKIIRQKFPDVRVLLTSGMEDAAMRSECLACGAHGFMAKVEVKTQFPLLVEEIFGKE